MVALQSENTGYRLVEMRGPGSNGISEPSFHLKISRKGIRVPASLRLNGATKNASSSTANRTSARK